MFWLFKTIIHTYLKYRQIFSLADNYPLVKTWALDPIPHCHFDEYGWHKKFRYAAYLSVNMETDNVIS